MDVHVQRSTASRPAAAAAAAHAAAAALLAACVVSVTGVYASSPLAADARGGAALRATVLPPSNYRTEPPRVAGRRLQVDTAPVCATGCHGRGACIADDTCACWAGYSSDDDCFAFTFGAPANDGMPDRAAANLPPFGPGRTTWVFVDAMKGAEQWASQASELEDASQAPSPWDDKRSLATRASDGYPSSLQSSQAAVTRVFAGIDGAYPGGDYTLLYDGTGTVTVGLDATSTTALPASLALQQGFVVRVEPTEAGVMVRINDTDAGDPVRNVRLIMPGYEHVYETLVFHPLLLSYLQRFRTLRVGLLSAPEPTSSSASALDWEDRVTTAWFTQGGPDGMAIEHAVHLANWVGANLWLSVSPRASDTYMTSAATQLQGSLAPNAKVYVELGASGFVGSSFASAQFTGAGLEAPAGTGLSTANARALCWQAQRSTTLWAAFAARFPAGRRVAVFQVPSDDAEAAIEAAFSSGCATTGGDEVGPAAAAAAHVVVISDATVEAPLTNSTGALPTVDQAMEVLMPLQADMRRTQLAGLARAARRIATHLLVGAASWGIKLRAPTPFPDADGGVPVEDVRTDTRLVTTSLYTGAALDGAGSAVTAFSGMPTAHDSRLSLFEYADSSFYGDMRYAGLHAYLDTIDGGSSGGLRGGCTGETDAHSLGVGSCGGNGVCGFIGGDCLCFYGYTGESCGTLDVAPVAVESECGGDECGDRGECVSTSVSPASAGSSSHVRREACLCDNAWQGAGCDAPFCPTNCHGRGRCNADAQCDCTPGFDFDPSCRLDCGCSGHGSCGPRGPGDVCACDQGFVWNNVTCVSEQDVLTAPPPPELVELGTLMLMGLGYIVFLIFALTCSFLLVTVAAVLQEKKAVVKQSLEREAEAAATPTAFASATPQGGMQFTNPMLAGHGAMGHSGRRLGAPQPSPLSRVAS